jgi:hypothetical protein
MYKTGEPLPKNISIEELNVEIERREKIRQNTSKQPRVGGRFSPKAKVADTVAEAISKGMKKISTTPCVTLEDRIRKVVREELAIFFSPEEPKRPSLLRRLKRWLI